MTHKDPTFWAVLAWQRRDKKRDEGCKSCMFRGERVFEVYLCGRGETPGKRGFCKMWRSDDNRAVEPPTQ